MKKSNLEFLFSLIIVVFPILNRYSAPFFDFITLSEFLLLILYPLFLIFIFKTNLKFIYIPFLILSIYIFINLIINLNETDDFNDLIGTSLRLFFLYFSISILSIIFFNIESSIKILIFISFFISVYGIFQYLFSFSDIYLSTYIPFLKIMGQFDIDKIVLEQSFYGIAFRSRSFLNEPAHFATYLLLPLVIVLFNRRYRNIKFSLIFSMGIFTSLSSTGIILLVLIWFLYLIKLLKNLRVFLITMFLCFSILILTYSLGLIDYFIERTFYGPINNLSDLLNNSRFYQILEVNYFSSFINSLFGHGLEEIIFYLPGYFKILYSFGILGFLIFTIILIFQHFNVKGYRKIISLVFIILNIGTEILLGSFTLFYLPFIISKESKPK